MVADSCCQSLKGRRSVPSVDFDALVRHGTINARDVELMHRTDSVDDAYDWIVTNLEKRAIAQPGATL